MSSKETYSVKFLPLASTVDSPFWVQYCHLKLETIQLSEQPIPIRGSLGCGEPRWQCQESSLSKEYKFPNDRIAWDGELLGFNTLEAFSKVDKNQLLKDVFLPRFLSGDSRALTRFELITFADLKNHKVVYWFAFPALMTKTSIQALPLNAADLDWFPDSFPAGYLSLRQESLSRGDSTGLPPFFVFAKSSPGTMLALDQSVVQTLNDEVHNLVFGFIDSSPSPTSTMTDQPPMGWTLRNLVAYLSIHLDLGGQSVTILSYRPQTMRRLSGKDEPLVDEADHSQQSSLALEVTIPSKESYLYEGDSYKVVGWELNARLKPGPRSVNLRPLLDSTHLAVQAADLNLKLMKWRMIPMLQVDMLQNTKVLLVGAGTLGCSVARTLLGWGVRQFTILDYGTVSYSNPARQNLFTLDDCHFNHGNGRPKAEAAAEALRSIVADVQAEGIHLSIPMPGHPESKEAIEQSVKTLDQLVQDCDVVYLLTDTRESRWLPTIMAAAHDKVLINAALGLDSWLVMRHGGGVTGDARLGCYFCNDVVAPENSTKNRTLDQQCTVTRPGLAPIASAMAVELMVSLLHHPQRQKAAAPSNQSSTFSLTVNDTSSSALGVIPHQIRGSLVSYTMMTPTVPAFRCCTGCSSTTIDAYKEDNIDLVHQVCQSVDGSFLEDLSGLTAFRAEAAEKMADMEDWDEDE